MLQASRRFAVVLALASLIILSYLYRESHSSSTAFAVQSEPLSKTYSDNSIATWTSQHLIDCKALLRDQSVAGDVGVFKRTSTNPPFQMNIYNPSKDGVSKVIFKEGCWECNHLTNMTRALSKYPNSYFLDIGGNIGMWSLTAAAAGYQTFTFEALLDNCLRFCTSVEKNGFYNRTHLMNIAATSDRGKFTLNVPDGNVGGTRVIAVKNDTTSGGNNNIVKGVPIDSLMLPMDRPVVMKVDVEGHELQALWGAIGFLNNANVVYAAMELRPNLHHDEKWKAIFDMLASKGLKPFRINYEDETPLDVQRLQDWKHFKHPMVRYYDVVWRRDDWDA